jgi:L-ascorbate metabolism protein UlaG (beta-lactamase superfamily)
LEEYKDDNIKIKAFGSTDAGGSFYIEHNDAKIFHAGDLNNWHWNEEVAKDESFVYENQYICELELLSEEVKEVDIAMFPLDPRLGKDFMRGGEQFIKRVKTHNLLPLHFGDNYKMIQQFEPIAHKAGTKLLKLENRGQSFKL